MNNNNTNLGGVNILMDRLVDVITIQQRNIGESLPQVSFNYMDDTFYAVGMIWYNEDNNKALENFKKSWEVFGNPDGAYFAGKLLYLLDELEEATKYFLYVMDNASCWYCRSAIDYLWLLKLKGK